MTEKKELYSLRFFLTCVVIATSLTLWCIGLRQSSIFLAEPVKEKDIVAHFVQGHGKTLESVKNQANSYWMRYADVRNDKTYGRKGTMGIYGAKEHFKHHGMKEGRVWGAIPDPAKPSVESELAEAYWRRYPEIEQSPVWGRNSELGTLGPRDHYHYRGKENKMIWGID